MYKLPTGKYNLGIFYNFLIWPLVIILSSPSIALTIDSRALNCKNKPQEIVSCESFTSFKFYL